MKTTKTIFQTAAFVVLAGLFTGCRTDDSGGSGNVSNNYYYGGGYYDPWYYGDYDDDHDHDVVVTPPPDNNRPDNGLRPTHPIARPPQVRPTPSPRPSIPSAPRPVSRGGGGRR
jgi:hypothetical protein